MAAPDLPPPPPTAQARRPVGVVLHPRLASPQTFQGASVVMVDNLRASVSIAAFLSAGAPFVVPCLTVKEARAAAVAVERATGSRALLAGERGGVLIEGFELGNSPREATPERIAARPVVFTTTNGTAALLAAAHARAVYVGCLANLAAVCATVAVDVGPVVILCAGTRDEVSLDDCLPAGAIIERLLVVGRELTADDSSRLCLRAWREAVGRGEDDLRLAMEDTRGGRNLLRLGLGEDVRFCSRRDIFDVVPRLHLGGHPALPDLPVLARAGTGGPGSA